MSDGGDSISSLLCITIRPGHKQVEIDGLAVSESPWNSFDHKLSQRSPYNFKPITSSGLFFIRSQCHSDTCHLVLLNSMQAWKMSVFSDVINESALRKLEVPKARQE